MSTISVISLYYGANVVYSSQSDLKKMAEVEDHIVPVRLELEHEGQKLKDTFMWNCSGTFFPPHVKGLG